MSEELVEVGREHVVHALGAGGEPVATVAPGTRLRIATELNIGDHLRDLSDPFDASMVRLPYVNPATGPIVVEGATPQHALVCDIEAMELEPPGFTALVPGFGPFTDWIRGREFGTHARVVDVTGGEVVWDERRRIPVAPMVGVLGTAPLVGAVSTVDNGPHGGNLDVQEMGPGCRVTLPIEVDGAHFFLGDCHAVQGDGELCGLGAIEIRTRTTVRLDLVDRPAALRWPRIETADHLGVVACARPLEDAFRLAVEDLVAWMAEDFGFAEHDAVLLLGQVAEARCTQLVNPKYTYVVKIAKRWVE
jgi:amidase